MRKLVVGAFVTLDGVMQAPGAPEEDGDGGFRHGGWLVPYFAADMGRDRTHPLRADWEQVKDDVMRAAVREKFRTHKDIQQVLLDTGDEELVENAPGDYYWGIGADGSGQNKPGIILMEVRKALRQ